jgi:hypothetical protein
LLQIGREVKTVGVVNMDDSMYDIMCLYVFFRLKEKRVAAIELATLAASGDDNKFRIVTEGG